MWPLRHLWQFFMTILMTIFDDLWYLRHWLQYWQLRTWFHDNLCYLTINCDTGQHSQFLRCFLLQEILLSSQPFLLGWWILLPFVTGSHFLLPFPWGRSATLWKLSSKWIVRYLKSICKNFWAKLPYITFNNLARRHPSFKAILTGFNHIIILLIFFTKEIKLQDCWSKVFEIDLSDDKSL